MCKTDEYDLNVLVFHDRTTTSLTYLVSRNQSSLNRLQAISLMITTYLHPSHNEWPKFNPCEHNTNTVNLHALFELFITADKN